MIRVSSVTLFSTLRLSALLALQNLWRNPRQSLLASLPGIAGLTALLLLSAINAALQENMVNNFQSQLIGSIQVHARDFFAHPRLARDLPDPHRVEAVARAAGVQSMSPRLESFVLAAARNSTGLMLIAIDPRREVRVTDLPQRLSAGQFLDPPKPWQCLLGEGAARKLGIGVGDSVDLISNDRFGAPTGERFEVAGLLSGGFGIDADIVFVPVDAAREMLAMDNRQTNLVMRVSPEVEARVLAALRAELPAEQYEVLAWHEMFPVMYEWIAVQRGFQFVFFVVVMLLVAAAIGNVALVANLNRRHEFGVMLAIGAGNRHLFRILSLESLFLAVVSSVVGTVLGVLVIDVLHRTGIDLSHWLGDTRRYYVDPILRPSLARDAVLGIGVGVFAFSLVAGLLPAWRSARLTPLEALSPHA
ncbi:MAG: ABC transporter permease [Gammaproteobacteria bacterium]|nr:ABC transporter permease [Gammaproteobacteria bacterium]MCP5136794.1 ABC transporter permease [Gammaproteobacteria bacterium]